MEQRMTGTFYGVSVGPGDPELLTLQAVRLLRQCPVLAAPQTASGQMLALDIARRALCSELDGQDHSTPAVCHEPGRRRAAAPLTRPLPAQCGLFWMPGRMWPC